MEIQDKLKYILELQEQNATIEEMAEKLEMTTKAIRSFMGRQNYKCKNGIFTKKEETNTQLSLTQDMNFTQETFNINNSISKGDVVNNENLQEKTKLIFVAQPSKRSGILEMTPELFDEICEYRDFYLAVKDLPQLKQKISKKNRTVIKDEVLIEEPFSKKIQTDKELWESLNRLSENSGVEINELISQAIKNLLKDYKHLI